MNNSRGKTIAKNTVMLYIRMLLSLIISLYTARVILEILDVENYGVYNLVGGVIGLFSFLNSSMAGATSRFITYAIGEGKTEDLNSVFNSAIIIHCFIALIILLFSETIGLWFLNTQLQIPIESKNAANWVYQFTIFSAMIAITQVPYTASIMSHEKMGIFAFFEIASSLLKLGAVFLLMIIPGNKLIIYGLLIMIISFIVAMSYRIYCVRKFNYCHIHFRYVKKSKVKSMLSFSGWDLMGNLSVMARTQGVSVLSNIFFGAVANAAIGIANQVQGALNGFASNVTIAMKPQIIKSYASNEWNYMSKLLMRGAKLSFLIIFFLALPVLIETKFILNLWLTQVPEYTVWICRWTLIFILFSNMSFVLVTGVHATGHLKGPSLVNGALYISVLPISYICFKLGSNIYIPFILNAVFVFIGAVANFLYTRKYVSALSIREFFIKVLIKCFLVSTLSSIIPILLFILLPNNWSSFIVVVLSCFICTCTVSWTFALDKDEKNLIAQYIKKINIFKSRKLCL